jgi:8-oxo-dGTP diphosphatase
MSESLPTVGVGAVIWNARAEVLLIQRGRSPREGEWSIPGGKVETGEKLHEALKREVREETGLEIEIVDFLDVIDLEEDGQHFVLVDFTTRHVSGEARAGSDAKEVRWVPRAELANYALWSETERIIALSAQQMGLD